MDEQQHVALPKLYGAPAYARPATVAAETPRPFDPDDLPLEAVRTDEDVELLSGLPAHAFGAAAASSNPREGGADGDGILRPRALTLRSLAGRILGQSDN
jgi:hypothetical protein